MDEEPDGDHAAVAARALVIAAEVVLARLRDPEFLRLHLEASAPAVVETSGAAPDQGASAGARWRSVAREGGRLAREGLATGLEKWSTQRPGTPHWNALTVDQRCDAWVGTLGRAMAGLAALPGLTGALGETVPVADLLSVGGQGLLLCAIAQEHGIVDRDDQVELLGAVILGREIAGAAGRARRREAQDEAGGLMPELAGRSTSSSSPAVDTAAAIVRMGRTVQALQNELNQRPRGSAARRIAGVVPVIGALGDYRDEREGLRRVAEQGREWCRTRTTALGPVVVPLAVTASAPPQLPVASDDSDAITVPLDTGGRRPTKGPGMEPVIGTKVKDKHAKAWLSALAPLLYPGEAVTALSRTTMLRPNCDALAVTNVRVMAFSSYEVEKGAKRTVVADDLARADVVKKTFGPNTLVVTSRTGEELSFGDIPAADQEMVLGVVRQLGLAGAAPDARRAMVHQEEADQRGRTAWDAVEVIGTAPSEKAWKTLKDHCSPGEVPWFVVGTGAGGVLAAFTDRAMVVKVGGMTSMMAGSLGGGRVTTFPYGEITGIEYNSGMLAGVLEILTPSYNGTANRDYWRGTRSSRNANADDPWTLSNTVPMPRELYQRALPRLNEMRARIEETKRPQAAAPPPAPGGIADELGKLAALRDQGMLSENEFQGAKHKVLAVHGLG